MVIVPTSTSSLSIGTQTKTALAGTALRRSELAGRAGDARPATPSRTEDCAAGTAARICRSERPRCSVAGKRPRARSPSRSSVAALYSAERSPRRQWHRGHDAWDCRAADPRPCAARPALFRYDAGHGYGMAGSRTPKPNVTRLKSVIGHSMFGIGMYMTAKLMEAVD